MLMELLQIVGAILVAGVAFCAVLAIAFIVAVIINSDRH